MSDASILRPPGYADLTEREKQTLRLMLRGHDAKSLARQLGLSVHTVNERLREARRKLSVSSSREAARMLFEMEGGIPENLGDTQIGEAGPGYAGAGIASPEPHRQPRRAAWLLIGGLVMSILLGMFILTWFTADAPVAAASKATVQAPAPAPALTSDAITAARAWLELSDAGRWEEGWRTACSSFRTANTAEGWANAGRQVRVPLGALVSRIAISQDSVPSPPPGIEMVKFRTRFANRAEAIETVALTREDGAWKMCGVYLE